MDKHLIVLGGPNGAGKTTTAELLFSDNLPIREFVNADEIAAGLSPFNPDGQAVRAGRLMLERINDLLIKESSFCFETTLSTRGFIRIIQNAQQRGYLTELVYLWLPNVDLAISRVHKRVEEGGHNIPLSDIKRRYKRSIDNLFSLYWHVFDIIRIYDSSAQMPELIAIKQQNLEILNKVKWDDIYGQKAT